MAAIKSQAFGPLLVRRCKRALLWLAILTLGLSTSGCSIRKLAYSWASRLLISRMTDTFDLNAAQKSDLSPRVAALHEWHRKTELPRYVELIDGIIARAQDGFDRQEVEWMLAQGTAAMERLSARLAPEAAAVMATLSDEQISHAVNEFKKGESERFEKLEQSEEEYVKYRLKMARKNLKTWFGSYTDAELQEFERFVRKNRAEELRRRKRYAENREALINAMHTHPGAAALSELIYRWLTKQEVVETPEFQRAEKAFESEFIDLVLAVDRLLTPEQRQHLIDELRSWRRDFYELANGN